MGIRDRLVDLFYAVFVRRDFGIPAEDLAKTVSGRRMRRCLLTNHINLVIDVGANVGQFVRKVRRVGYTGQIVSFEPNPHPFAELVNRWGDDSAWRGYPYALGDVDGEQALHLAEDSRLTSFLQPKADIPVVARSPVTVKRLDTIFAELSQHLAEPRALLKLDTQGYDLHVVRGASACLDQIPVLLSEISVVPIYERMTPYYDALRLYAELGFRVVDFSVVNRTREDHVIEFDCLLERLNAT